MLLSLLQIHAHFLNLPVLRGEVLLLCEGFRRYPSGYFKITNQSIYGGGCPGSVGGCIHNLGYLN